MDRAPRGIRIRDEAAKVKPDGTYKIEAYCTNCDWDGEVELPKGVAAPYGEPLEGRARCENCGCHTLVRHAAAAKEVEETTENPAEISPQAETVEERIRRILDEIAREQGRTRREPTPITPWAPPGPHWEDNRRYTRKPQLDHIRNIPSECTHWTTGTGNTILTGHAASNVTFKPQGIGSVVTFNG